MKEISFALNSTLLQLGRPHHLRPRMVGGTKITTQTDPYYILIQDGRPEINQIQAIYRSPRSPKPCIDIIVFTDVQEAVLEQLNYDAGCMRSGNMVRGDQTKAMIHHAINWAKANGAKFVDLSDKATILCNGVEIPLGPMYFYKFGQTWYEKHFGFRAQGKHAERYENAKKLPRPYANEPCDFFTFEKVTELGEKPGSVKFHTLSWRLEI